MGEIQIVKKGRGKRLLRDGEPITLTVQAYLPFGVEFYNNSLIVNLEINDNNNEDINTAIEFITTEREICKVVPESIKQSRTLISGIRQRDDYKKHIRTYLSKIDDERPVVPINLVGKRCEVVIRFTSLWTSQTSYGVMINLISIKESTQKM